jgi:hypothetical protein
MLAKRILITTAVLITLASAPLNAGATTKHWYDPITRLRYQPTIRCILRTESTSTEARPNTRDVDPYQFGPFQFTPILWDRWSWAAGVGTKTKYWTPHTTALNAVTIPAYKATLEEQAIVFAEVARYDGLWPWTRHDGC